MAMSATSLFVALGGTAVAVSRIGTKQLKNGAVSGAKLQNGAVSTSKLRNGAVTGSKLAADSVTGANVVDGSLSASDVAANTFLDAKGTAADSARLGGLLPGDFVQGVGIMSDRRVVVTNGTSTQFLNTLFGTFTGTCAGNQPSVSWSPTVANAEYAANVQVFGAPPRLVTLNGIPAGGSDPEPTPAAGPFMTTYQVGYTATGQDHVATAIVTGRFEAGTGCVFTGQFLSTG
jgi:hypothetical protein